MANSAIGATGAIAALPAGVMIDYAGSTAPSGWIMCDGSAVSRTVYASLFTAIGTTYGSGDGSTTFNLPDFRGRFARYMDNMGTPAGAAGRDSGRALGTTQVDATAAPSTAFTVSSATVNSTGNKNQFNTNQTAHSHNLGTGAGATAAGSSFTTPNFDGLGGAVRASQTSTVSWASANFSVSGTASGQTVSGGGDAETRPINLACNRIIKY